MMVKRHNTEKNICDDGASTAGAAALGVFLFILCLAVAGLLMSATA